MSISIQNNSRRYTFDSLANLRLLSGEGLDDNNVVDISGHTTEGDGGGGSFFWDATSTATDNGGTIVKLADTTTGRFIRSDQTDLTLVMFGGFTGASVATELQAASDAIASGRLRVTAGSYTVATTVTRALGDFELLLDPGAVILVTVSTGNAGLSIAGTLSSALSVTADITQGGTTFTVSTGDSATLSAGDYVKVSSAENYFVTAGRDYKKGELLQVASVDTGTGIVTVEGEGVVLQYTESGNSLQVQKMNFISNVKITGAGGFTGEGQASGQHPVKLSVVKNLEVTGIFANDFKNGIHIDECLNGSVHNCDIYDVDDATTGYGIQVSGVSQNISVSENVFDNCRHGFTTSGEDGVVMYVSVFGNKVNNSSNAGLNNHGNSRYCSFTDNHVHDSNIGISWYAPFTTIKGNTVSNILNSALYGIEAGGANVVVDENIIDNCSNGFFGAISILVDATTVETNAFVSISDNVISNAPNGTGINVGTGDAQIVTVNGNTTNLIGYDGIKIASGEDINVVGNALWKSVRPSTAGISAIEITNTAGVGAYGSKALVSSNLITNFEDGIVITAVDTATITGNEIHVNGVAFNVTATTLIEGVNNPQMFTATLVWNPGSLADGVGETSSGITVTGAALGDYVQVAAPYDLQDMIVTAYVQAANTVEIRIQNESTATIDLASGTWKVRVVKS